MREVKGRLEEQTLTQSWGLGMGLMNLELAKWAPVPRSILIFTPYKNYNPLVDIDVPNDEEVIDVDEDGNVLLHVQSLIRQERPMGLLHQAPRQEHCYFILSCISAMSHASSANEPGFQGSRCGRCLEVDDGWDWITHRIFLMFHCCGGVRLSLSVWS